MVEKKDYPKILIVSRLNWDDDSNSNSLTNFFDGYDPEKIARIYIETKIPNTKCCHHFFQISEVSLIRRIFKWKTKTGHVIDTNKSFVHSKDQEAKEDNLMSFARHHRSFFLTILRDVLWSSGGWKSKELKSFVSDFNPDVVWLDGSPLIFMNKLNNYICSIAAKPSVTFVMDDVYTYKSCPTLMSRIYRLFIRKHVKKTIVKASHVFVSSEKMKREYDEIFSINSTFLAKGVNDFISIDNLPQVHNPIKLVYLGNVLIGRFDSLILLAEAIHAINVTKGKTFELSVYTGDYIADEDRERFLLDDSIHLCKPVPYHEVNNVMNQNDIVVFVEALEGKLNCIARLSFSTKIVDYIVSGKCILAIGAADLSPIEYLDSHGLSLTATKKEDIYKVLETITPEVMHEKIKNSLAFAKTTHNKRTIQNNVYGILSDVAIGNM